MVLLLSAARPALAQEISFSGGVHAIGLYTHVDPIPGGGTADEARLVQPTIMLRAGAWRDRLVFTGTAGFEGLTIPGGELAPGAWGEGFVDRRHPHTYVHELMLSGNDLLGRVAGRPHVSLSLGKGFVPFGTDDPMSRPVIRYPVNHHLSQILERAVGIVGLRSGPVTAEAALFNGDEPERPGEWPRVARFGDSWSVRATVTPVPGLELQGSHAHVHSPEHRPGAGPDQTKWSASARWERGTDRDGTYALAEWARTSEAQGFFVYHSLLAEGAWTRGAGRLLWRIERTERPEEPRTTDLFRTVRPHLDNTVLAQTRWTIATLGYSVALLNGRSRFQLDPQVEVSYGGIRSLTGPGFDPATFYDRDNFWSINAGVRLGWGMKMHRMGRYGVMESAGMDMPAMEHTH